MTTVGFNGLTVAAFESRMATEITRLIERHGGTPLVTPALREIPLDDNSAALKFGVRLTTEQVDLLILLTGAGNILVNALDMGQYDTVYAMIIIIGAMGIGLDAAFEKLRGRLVKWSEPGFEIPLSFA
jgi:hypothetical protein